MKRWFVTGTDTEVGKTMATSALLQSANLLGLQAAGYKPVASGSEIHPDGVFNHDALLLQNYSNVPVSYKQVNPLTFIEPTSPHIASKKECIPIPLSTLSSGLRQMEKLAEYIFIEGAGGWFTPLSEENTYADWVELEKLSVILVVGIKLGCINHALLTANAVRSRGIKLAGWVANDIQPVGDNHGEYLSYLKKNLNAPFLGEIPYLNTHSKNMDCSKYLDLSELKIGTARYF